MTDESILTPEQRTSVARFAQLGDEDLLAEAADRIGLTGELAIDQDGIIELERDDVLVVLEQVGDEDRELVEHPDHLYLSVYVRPESDEQRAKLEEADLLEPVPEGEELEEGWRYAWWGGMPTQLKRDAELPAQLEALNRVMEEAHAVLEGRDIALFFRNMKWIEMPSEE